MVSRYPAVRDVRIVFFMLSVLHYLLLRSALALANDLNDRAPESESQKSAQPVMITLSRVQVSELYSKRVLHYNGYTFKMKP